MDDVIVSFACGAIMFGMLLPDTAISPKEIAWAQSVCEANGGIKSVRAGGRFLYDTQVICNNTATFEMGSADE